MTKFRKFTDWLWYNQWIFAPILYVAFCIWVFFTTEAEIGGVRVDRVTAGIAGLITTHVVFLLAIGGAWLLGKIIELITRRKWRKSEFNNKKTI